MSDSPLPPKRPRLSSPLALATAFEHRASGNAQQDIIDFLSQRGNRANDLQNKINELEETNRRLQQDLLDARAHLDKDKETVRLELQSAEAAKAMYKREQEAAEQAYKKEMERTADLLAKFKWGEDQRYEALQRSTKAEARLAEAKDQFRKEEEALLKKLRRTELSLQAAEQNAQLSSLTNKPITTASGLDSKSIEVLKHHIAEADSSLAESRGRCQELETLLAQQEQRANDAEAALRQAHRASDSSNADIIRALRSELRSQEAEIANARKIQGRVKSLSIMQEKLQAAEARADRAEGEQHRALDMQAKVSALEIQLQAWEASANRIGVESPQEVSEKLEQIREECLTAANSLSDRESALRKLRESLKVVEGQKAEAEATLHSVQGANAELIVSAAKFERRVTLLNKEKEGLQRMLASFKAEEVMSPNPTGGKSAVQADELTSLTDQVEELKRQVDHLEESASQSATATKALQEELADALTKATRQEEEKHQVELEVERLENEVGQLQDRVDNGEFNPATTRVLHYVLNPEAEARKEQQQARVAELESEIAVLKLQLQKVADGSAAQEQRSYHNGPSAANAVLEAEIIVLQQKVADLTKRETRLKDVFQNNVSNFREAVYCLFGYRVDMAAEAASTASLKCQSTTFVLKPQHADSSRMQLMFHFQGGEMKLIHTEYTAKKLKREVETFIERFKSIPAFTANLTMELFQKQTQC